MHFSNRCFVPGLTPRGAHRLRVVHGAVATIGFRRLAIGWILDCLASSQRYDVRGHRDPSRRLATAVAALVPSLSSCLEVGVRLYFGTPEQHRYVALRVYRASYPGSTILLQ